MIEVKNINFRYQKEKVLDDVEFKAKKGELVCLLGPNGSGKTTVLKCLNGLLKPESGGIYLDGDSLYEMKRKEIARRISVVPQQHSMVFAYRTLEVVMTGITPYLPFGKMPSPEDYKQASDILRKLNIANLAERPFNRLSGGEKQLVLIAKSLMQDTDYIIMDEPTTHLDFKNQYLIMEKLKKLARRDKGVIIALHDPNLALRFCDRVIMIKEGRIMAEGETKEVMTAENLRDLYGLDVLVNDLSQGRKFVGVKFSVL